MARKAPTLSELSHEIVIQENQATASLGNGNKTPNWVTVKSAYAKVDSPSGSEQFYLAQMNAVETLRFTIRYPKDVNVTAAMRIQYNGKTFDIKSAVDSDGRRFWMELTAVHNTILV